MDNIFNDEAPQGKGVLCVLGSSGDIKIFWDKKNKTEVEEVRATFNRLVKEKKYAAFSMSKDGRRNKKITEFSPQIRKLILIPPIAGGSSLPPPMEYGQQPEVPGPCTPFQNINKEDTLKNEVAAIKAMTLLKKKIGEEKFVKLVAVGYVEIKGKYGLYKIDGSKVTLERSDKIGEKIRPLVYTLCVNVSEQKKRIPLADKILSLYLFLKNDEENFIKTANFRDVSTSDEFQERERIGIAL